MDKTELPSNRSFGLFVTAVASAFSVFFVVTARPTPAAVAALLAAAAALAAVLKPNLLAPLNKAWMMLGMALGAIVSPIVLAILFFGLFTPLALLLRLLGRDELRLRRAANGAGYWRLRQPPGPEPDSFRRQF
ncbi:MAG TPA: SxtJ family membrane protein [Sphingomicrobium sp.]|nr:SxtJ family membrane protein [Sphingomicrobium sp.]